MNWESGAASAPCIVIPRRRPARSKKVKPVMPEFALLSYVAVMSITPGPNNLMLTASGVNFGFRRTIPHMLGISLGCAFQVFLVGSLLSLLLDGIQAARLPLALLGCAYLLWLSWKIARAGQPEAGAAARPLGFVGAALFQWLNPKAWVMVINAAILFMPAADGQRWLGAAMLAAVFAVVNLPCIGVWAWAGERLRAWLASPRALPGFNLSMGVLMAATALWLLYDEFQPQGPARAAEVAAAPAAPRAVGTMSVFDSGLSVISVK